MDKRPWIINTNYVIRGDRLKKVRNSACPWQAHGSRYYYPSLQAALREEV